jgi:STE24 endopeptidase
MTIFSLLNFLPMMVMMTLAMTIPEISQSYGFELPSILFAFYLSFGNVLAILSTLIMMPFNAISRKMERRADSFACSRGYGADLVSGLKKLHKDSLADMNPHPVVVKLMYSHPPLHERIELVNKKNK